MSNLTASERERLLRYRAAYAASTLTGEDQQTGNRLGFVRWLVATGDLTDWPAPEDAARPWDADEIAEWDAMPHGGW